MRKDDELRYPFKEIGGAEAKTGGSEVKGGQKVARPPGTPANGNGSGVTSAAGQAFQKAKAQALRGKAAAEKK